MSKTVKAATLGIQGAVSVAIVAVILGAMIVAGQSNTILPQTPAEYASTSVMVINNEKTSGGSGVILRSTPQESYILTNRHVCQVIQRGGTIRSLKTEAKISGYKVYKKHDLCLVKVNKDLGISTVVATKDAPLFTEANASGHPQLLPHILSKGNFSERKEIEIVVGIKKCTGDEKGEEILYCIFMGGKPVIKKFQSQVISSLIMPGSSGSAVFNAKGEVTALVFAGSQGLSYGFIVPHEFLVDFLANQNNDKWSVPNSKSNKDFMSTAVFKAGDACASNFMLESFCSRLAFPGLWRQK